MKNRGFTLIELMISIAMIAFIMGMVGEIILFSTQAYTINLEIADSITKIKPVLKRIEHNLVENSLTVTAILLDLKKDSYGNIVGIKIKNKDNNIYWFWWDNTGVATKAPDGINIDRINQGMNIFRDNIPLFRSKGLNYEESSVKIKNFNFELYSTNKNTNKTKIITTTASAVYLKINVEIEGAISENKRAPKVKFSTGFKFK